MLLVKPNSGRQTQRKRKMILYYSCAIAILKSVLNTVWIILKSQTLVKECCQNFWCAHITMRSPSYHIWMCHNVPQSLTRYQRGSVNCVFVPGCLFVCVSVAFLCLGVCVSVNCVFALWSVPKWWDQHSALNTFPRLFVISSLLGHFLSLSRTVQKSFWTLKSEKFLILWHSLDLVSKLRGNLLSFSVNEWIVRGGRNWQFCWHTMHYNGGGNRLFWFAWHCHLLACLQKDVGGQIFAGQTPSLKMIVKVFASCLLAVAAASSESSSSESGSREGFRLWFECISVLKQGNILTLQKYQLDLNL